MPNSKYEDINKILYRPSLVSGGGAEQVWGDCCKTATGLKIYISSMLTVFEVMAINIHKTGLLEWTAGLTFCRDFSRQVSVHTFGPD